MFDFLVSNMTDDDALDGRGGLKSKMGKNCLGEVVKEAFSSGVKTTLLCEQVTIGVTSFGELLSQRRSQRRPKQK